MRLIASKTKKRKTNARHRTGGRLLRLLIRLAPVLLLVVFLTVPIAHAQEAAGTGCNYGFFSAFTTKGCLQTMVLGLLETILGVEARIFTLGLGAIRLVASWQADVNNAVVFGVWSIARDFANIFFVVGLIVISFATIFRATGISFFRNWHYQSALPGLLIAAILVNFSLGISDVVVLTTNQVTSVFTNIADRANVNLATAANPLQLEFKPQALVDTSQTTVVLEEDREPAPPSGSASEGAQEVRKSRSLSKYLSYGACLILGVTTAGVGGAACALGVSAVSSYIGDDTAPTIDASNASGVALTSTFFLMAIYVVMIISVWTAAIFFIIRVVALWILAAFSAFAFGFMWVNRSILSGWWKQFFGWSIFGPAYLLVIIFGMTFMVRGTDLLFSLTSRGDIVVMPLVQVLLNYTISAIVLLGGLALVMNSSFAAGVKSTAFLGALAQKAGVFSARELSGRFFGAVGRRATALPRAAVQARGEKLAQDLSRLRPQFLRPKSEEQLLAEARRRRGVFGGAQQETKLLDKRIEGASANLNDRTINMSKSQREAFLRKRVNSRNRDEALAARQMLMSDGKLSGKEISETRGKLPNEMARKNFDKQLDKVSQLNPQAVYEHKIAQLDKKSLTPEKQQEILQETFSKILSNPGAVSKLGKEYFDASSEQYKNLKSVIDTKYPDTGTREDARRRKQAEQNMIRRTNSRDQQNAIQGMYASRQTAGAQPAPTTTTRSLKGGGNIDENVRAVKQQGKERAEKDIGSSRYGADLSADEIQERIDAGGADIPPEELKTLQRNLREARARENQALPSPAVEAAKRRSEIVGSQRALDKKIIDLRGQQKNIPQGAGRLSGRDRRLIAGVAPDQETRRAMEDELKNVQAEKRQSQPKPETTPTEPASGGFENLINQKDDLS